MELPSVPAAVILEAQAWGVLRAHQGDDLEARMADQAWKAAEDGSWRVEPDCDGWTFRVEAVPGGTVRVIARPLKPGPSPHG